MTHTRKSIRIDKALVTQKLGEVIRVEGLFNNLLATKANKLCAAGQHAGIPDRTDTLAGYYERRLETKTGKGEKGTENGMTNPMEQIMREIRKRTLIVGNLVDDISFLMLVTTRLRYGIEREWDQKQDMNM